MGWWAGVLWEGWHARAHRGGSQVRSAPQLVLQLCRVLPPFPTHILPGAEHVTLRALPGMADRCLRVGSAGKTFSFTAWKVSLQDAQFLPTACEGGARRSVAEPLQDLPQHPPLHLPLRPSRRQVGWVTGPRDMVAALTKAKQFLTFTSE